MNKLIEAGAIGVAAGLILTACDNYQAPIEEAPNNTLDQVGHNLGYEKTLGNLTLSSQVDIPLVDGKMMHVYNFTPTPVDPLRVTKIANAVNAIASVVPSTKREIIVYPPELKIGVPITTSEVNHTGEHDLLLVPMDTAMPKLFTHDDIYGNSTAITRDMKSGQTISVVKQENNDSYQPGNFVEQEGLPTEICQSELEVFSMTTTLPDSTGSAEDQPSYNEINHLAQETVCNSIGKAIAKIETGVDYSLYVADAALFEGTVSYGGSVAKVIPNTLTAEQYASLQTQLQ